MDDFRTTDPGDAGGGAIDGPDTLTGPGGDLGAGDPASQPGNIGDALGHDPGNIGRDVTGSSDRTFPDPQVSDKTF